MEKDPRDLTVDDVILMHRNEVDRSEIEDGLAAFLVDLDLEEQNMRDAGVGASADCD